MSEESGKIVEEYCICDELRGSKQESKDRPEQLYILQLSPSIPVAQINYLKYSNAVNISM